jgi:hypothetical protein
MDFYSQVSGTIISVTNEQHGSGTGLTNKQIHIRPDDYPAFTIIMFHCDLLSGDVKVGATVGAGELNAYARMYYPDLNEYANDFDIAVRVSTPDGARLISYFTIITNDLFNSYISRGASVKLDFIITRDARDADPLECDGETFLTSGNLENWFTLN